MSVQEQDAQDRRPVILTTDCGTEMDDQWAIAHLALSPGIELRGVVTNHAPNLKPPAAETAARAVNDVLDHLPLTVRPPVLAGASEPLVDRQTPRPNPGNEFILKEAQGHSADDRLVVLVIGTATDVVSALLIDPTLVDRIEIVSMAFDGWPDGGDDWNVRNDVAAWQTMLASGAPLTVGDAAVCRRQLILSVERARTVLADTGAAGDYLIGLLADWLGNNAELARQVTGDAASWPVWDEVVVAHLLGMTTTASHPRPALRPDISLDHSAVDGAVRPVQWITDFDGDRLWKDLQGRLRISQGRLVTKILRPGQAAI